MYLPPYWFHCVESLNSRDDSGVVISVNSWTYQSPFTLPMEEIYLNKFYAPFFNREGETSKLTEELENLLDSELSPLIKQFVVGKIFIEELLTKLGKNDMKFIEKLYHTRYQPLFEARDSSSSISSFFCLTKDFSQLYKTKKKEITQFLLPFVQHAADAFGRVESQGRQEIHLANYLEDLVDECVGIDNVSLTLKHCFETITE